MKAPAFLACALLFAAAAPAAAPEPAAAAPAMAPAADVPRKTVDGHAFVAPAGWTVSIAGPATLLSAPEPGSRIALIDIAAPDADAAIAAAWTALGMAAPALRQAADRPARDGWEQIRAHAYASAPQRVVGAQARRAGARWNVAITDMDRAVAATRDAQVKLVFGQLHAKGFAPETFAGRTALPLDAARLAALRTFVDAARRQFDVPGVAIGLVQDGKVVLAEGLGVRELGKPDAVDADTLFYTASNTKALTSLMLAKQVEAGRFGWDTPVAEVMPAFRIGDAETTQRMQMRHLLCACTGLPRQDMEWVFDGEHLTPATVMHKLATMRPTAPLGAQYQYSNPMAAAAGYVGGYAAYPGRELGAAYDAAMQSLVFDPLAMHATTFDFARARRGPLAMPHSHASDGRTVALDPDINLNSYAMRPDGGAWSNVNDLLRYVQMELADGRLPDGRRYIATAPLLARRAQQVARGAGQGYGMGLKLDRTTGALLVHVGGTMPGYVSDMMWLPEHGVGAVVLTNADDGGIHLRSLFRRRLLELLFDGRPEAEAAAPAQARRMRDELAAARQRVTLPADPSLELATRYRSAELGDIVVARRGATTWFDFGGWASEMASQRGDDGAPSLVTVSGGVSGYRFGIADADGKRALVLRDAQREYRFDEAQ